MGYMLPVIALAFGSVVLLAALAEFIFQMYDR
ncbi:hypothetical protein FDH96_gp090 [Mycobacterium phage Rey]|uniref:Uncharacterized protein n=1 Tax=Mycobacterium phage Rey TaxID=1034115 RepID=G1D5F2_9CAUD|nr:hypothetical protein FDH96_gp090 [Mycobacterium phage Rey]AEK10001.1 hypothetical protein PBI_REY_90 [Mycobacterium phage Rey]